MNGRVSKKIRKEMNKRQGELIEQFWSAVKNLPFRKRIKLAWKVIIAPALRSKRDSKNDAQGKTGPR